MWEQGGTDGGFQNAPLNHSLLLFALTLTTAVLTGPVKGSIHTLTVQLTLQRCLTTLEVKVIVIARLKQVAFSFLFNVPLSEGAKRLPLNTSLILHHL